MIDRNGTCRHVREIAALKPYCLLLKHRECRLERCAWNRAHGAASQ